MKSCPRCGELLGDTVDKCFKCHFELNNPDELVALEKEKLELEKERLALEQKKKQEEREMLQERLRINDIYEYDVVTVFDKADGGADVNMIQAVLTNRAKEGWRLVTAITNELGKNTSNFDVGGMSSGTNATIDETVLIFERCKLRYRLTE